MTSDYLQPEEERTPDLETGWNESLRERGQKPAEPVVEEEVDDLHSPEVLHRMETGGFMMTPGTPTQVAQILSLAREQGQPLALSEAEAALLPQPVWLNLSRLNNVRKYRTTDLTITVETGVTFKQLSEILKAEGHCFPLQYTGDTPLADILAEDRPALETGFRGYPRDWVLGLEIATPDGQITKCGGEVVKNVSGYDLNKLYVGAHHTLGVVTAATLKLAPLPESSRSWLFEFEDVNLAFASARRFLQKDLPMTRCEVYHKTRMSPAQQRKATASWQLFLELAGDTELLKHTAPYVREWAEMPESEANLLPARRNALAKVLSKWPTKSLVVEVALPYGKTDDFYFHLATLFPSEDFPALQIRPAAGLMYLVWVESKLQTLVGDAPAGKWPDRVEALRAKVRQMEGHLRVEQAPDFARPWLEAFNLPADPTVRLLMKRLKMGYDPRGVLFTPRLPLISPEGN